MVFFMEKAPYHESGNIASHNGGLLAALRGDVVPRLLRDVPNQPSPEELENNPLRCRFAVVFVLRRLNPVKSFVTKKSPGLG